MPPGNRLLRPSRRTFCSLLLTSLIATGLVACSTAAPRRYPDAEFIFRGTTVLPRASTINAEDVSSLAIVRVEEIVHAPAALAGLMGSEITVRLRNPATAREGEQRIYFANGWHWGDGIGVVEISSVGGATREAVEAIRPQIESSRQAHSDSVLRARLQAAELVIVGRVTAVRPSNVPRLISEHDPAWREAEIAVDAALKGRVTEGRTVILFPGTDDPMWYRTPRFALGAEGIFILHRLKWPGQPLPYLVAIQPEDFQPVSELPRVRSLLGR